MSNELTAGLRQHWWLALLAVGLLSAGVAGMVLGGGGDGETEAEAAPAPEGGGGFIAQASDSQQPLRPTPRRTDPKAEARAIIAEHEAKIEQDIESEESADLLYASGNLYRQKLMDYERAADCYELLLEYHPDFHSRAMVYSQLSKCYTELGDQQAANKLHRRMMEEFPEDSQEYLFAKQQLGW